MTFIWAIIVGAIVGFIARLVSRAPNKPSGFILTVILGIAGGEVATYIGRALHWYGPDQSAGLIASVIGAVIVLWVWHLVTRGRYRTGYPPAA